MGLNILDAFFITLGLDTSNFDEEAGNLDDKTKRLNEANKRAFDQIEARGKKTADAFRALRNETAGLFLTFVGASSITNFIGNMMAGAMSADRMGASIGMATDKIWGWRRAMRDVGGKDQEADAALAKIAQDRQMFRLTGRTSDDANYARFGITPRDMTSGDAGDVLMKIARNSKGMSKPELTQRLQMMGIPQSMIYAIEQGPGVLAKSVEAGRKNAATMEESAKTLEDAQKKLAQAVDKLTPEITRLVGVLVDKVVPVLDFLAGRGGSKGSEKDPREVWRAPGILGDVFSFRRRDPGPNQDPVGDPYGMPDFMKKSGPARGTRAERNNNPGNIEDGRFARSQPGYVGSDGRFAIFATAEHGFAAMKNLLGRYVRDGRDTIASIVRKYAPASENNTMAYVAQIERATGIRRDQKLTTQSHLDAVARAMARHEGYRKTIASNAVDQHRRLTAVVNTPSVRGAAARGSQSTVHIARIDVHTQATDAKGIARDLGGALRNRSMVAQADTGLRA